MPRGSPGRRGSSSRVTVTESPHDTSPPAATLPPTPAATAVGSDDNRLRLYVDRDESDAPTFQFKLTGKRKRGEITPNARSNLLIELAGAKDREETAAIQKHYGVGPQTVSSIKKLWRKNASCESAPRTGRPSVMNSPTHLQGLRELNRSARAAGVAKLSKMSVVDPRLLGGKRPHRKKRRKGVSPSTIWRWKKKVQYVTKRTKWRPKVKSKEHAKARVKFSRVVLKRKLQETCDGDEKVYVVPKAKRICRHPDSDVEEIEDEIYRTCVHKRHLPHVMALAWVSQPVIKQGWTDPNDMWERDGKIGIWRVAEIQPQKNGKLMKDKDGNQVYYMKKAKRGNKMVRGQKRYLPGCKPGWLRLVDVTMDAKQYNKMMIEKVLPATVEYFGEQKDRKDEFRAIAQEDGAAGHGMNTHTRTPNATHDEIESAFAAHGIDLGQQSSRTPSLNANDLGVWWAVDSGVCQRYDEFTEWKDKDTILDKLWQVVEEEFWELDPALLHSIFEHKKDMAKEIIKQNGYHVKKEPHAGARRRTRKYIEANRGDMSSSSDDESSESEDE